MSRYEADARPTFPALDFAKLRGVGARNAKDMVSPTEEFPNAPTWGELRAIRKGGQGHYHFECVARGHRVILSGQTVRANHRARRETKCPECK